jgi:F-type H+-transporting ATPase subunit gamma
MESIKDIRGRMLSVRKTMKITNAMYLMASSKTKKARKNLAASEPYFLKLQKTITDILRHTHIPDIRYFDDNEVAEDRIKRCYIVITSDKGLAGAYNQNVIRLTEAQLNRSEKHNPENNTLLFIGYTAHNYFKKKPQLAQVDFDTAIRQLSLPCSEPGLWRNMLLENSAAET